MSNFQAGEVVQMKSGGPVMTVSEVRDDGKVVCHWFTENGKQEIGTFPAVVLDRFE